MTDLRLDLPALLAREEGSVLVPELSELRVRSRRRRQRHGAGLFAALALTGGLVLGSLPGNSSDRVGIASAPLITLDLYPQARLNPPTLRTSGDPVLHLHVVRAEVTRDPLTGAVAVVLGLDPASQKEFSAIGPGQQAAFVIDGEVISAPLFQAHIVGDAQLTSDFTVEQATALAHRLTDNVVVNAG
jgi:hypothetical protein